MNLISQASEEKPKKVLVTGILGQDGANMAEYLLSTTNHQVFGMMRRSANLNFINTKNFKDKENFKIWCENNIWNITYLDDGDLIETKFKK